MKLTVAGFIYFLKLSLLLRGIFASSLDDEECIEREDSSYTGYIIKAKTSRMEYTERETSIVYMPPQDSSNTLMGEGNPTTILVASTLIEVITITPGSKGSEESFKISEDGATVAQTIANETASEIITVCPSCIPLTNDSLNGNEHTKKPTPSITSLFGNLNSATTVRSISHTVPPVGVVSDHYSKAASYYAVSTAQPTPKNNQTYTCGTDICLSTNNTTSNVPTPSSTSQGSTNFQESKTELTSKDSTHKATRSSLKPAFVATTSYHYFDSAGQKRFPNNLPIFLALLLSDYIYF